MKNDMKNKKKNITAFLTVLMAVSVMIMSGMTAKAADFVGVFDTAKAKGSLPSMVISISTSSKAPVAGSKVTLKGLPSGAGLVFWMAGYDAQNNQVFSQVVSQTVSNVDDEGNYDLRGEAPATVTYTVPATVKKIDMTPMNSVTADIDTTFTWSEDGGIYTYASDGATLVRDDKSGTAILTATEYQALMNAAAGVQAADAAAAEAAAKKAKKALEDAAALKALQDAAAEKAAQDAAALKAAEDAAAKLAADQAAALKLIQSGIENGELYVVQPGDCLVNIAEKLYSDPKLYSRIYDLNKAIVKDPNVINVGSILVLPASGM